MTLSGCEVINENNKCKAQQKDGKMYSKPFKWEGIAGRNLKQLSIFSFMHHFTSFYMQWVFFISQKIHLLKAEILASVVGKCLTKKKAVKKYVFSHLHFFLSFQLILSSLCLFFSHHLKYFYNFTNLKQEHEPSHLVLSYLWQEWGFIHKAFWNGLSIIGISTELENVLVIVLEKKTDKKESEIVWLAPCYLCGWTKGGCTVGSGGKGGRLSNRLHHYFFFLSCLSQEI